MFAIATELDQWLAAGGSRPGETEPTPPAEVPAPPKPDGGRTRSRVWAMAGVMVVVTLLAGLVVVTYRGRPATIDRVRIEGEVAVASAADGRILWKRPVPAIPAGFVVGSVVARFGHRVGVFVNSGWLRTAKPSADGRYVIVGGFSNSRDGAAFAVLDARHPGGTSPEDPGSKFECTNCPAGRPVRYFVVRWGDVATEPLDRRNAVVFAFANGTTELRAIQHVSVEVIVELSPALEVTSRRVSDAYWTRHQHLEKEGSLKHTRAECPFPDGPIVKEWTTERGWRDLPAR